MFAGGGGGNIVFMTWMGTNRVDCRSSLLSAAEGLDVSMIGVRQCSEGR